MLVNYHKFHQFTHGVVYLTLSLSLYVCVGVWVYGYVGVWCVGVCVSERKVSLEAF